MGKFVPFTEDLGHSVNIRRPNYVQEGPRWFMKSDFDDAMPQLTFQFQKQAVTSTKRASYNAYLSVRFACAARLCSWEMASKPDFGLHTFVINDKNRYIAILYRENTRFTRFCKSLNRKLDTDAFNVILDAYCTFLMQIGPKEYAPSPILYEPGDDGVPIGEWYLELGRKQG